MYNSQLLKKEKEPIVSLLLFINTRLMVTTVLSHEVKNFSEWKKGFDSDAENRSKMGVNITGVYQSVDNPNMVTVIGEVPSVEAIRGFLSDPNLKATMEQAGVIGMPEIKILNKV